MATISPNKPKQLDLFDRKRVTLASHNYMLSQIHQELNLQVDAESAFTKFIDDNERAYDEYLKYSAWHIPKKSFPNT